VAVPVAAAVAVPVPVPVAAATAVAVLVAGLESRAEQVGVPAVEQALRAALRPLAPAQP
jgi:hypothetical protein